MPKSALHIGVVAKAALTHFAVLLRVGRKQRNLTLDEVADRLGVSTPTVRKMLDGSPSVAVGTYFEAAHLLGVALFDPDPNRFATIASRTAEVESLLPQRIRPQNEVIDDNF